jgi:hypothetical protein
MPFGIGFWANGARAATGAFDLLETTVLTGSQAAVEFTNLTTKYASTYQHLQIRGVARTSQAATRSDMAFRLNGDTNNNYAGHSIYGFSGSVFPGFETSVNRLNLGWLAGANASSSIFAPFVIDLLDPFETKNKTMRSLNGIPHDSLLGLLSGVWLNTTSVTSISIASQSGNLVQGTRISLYGLRAS